MTVPSASDASDRTPKLFAISDLHVAYTENRDIVESLRPESPDDWLIVAGDTAEKVADVEWALRTLAGRFAKVVWTPGNHELWTHKQDPVQLRGDARYQHLVARCRELGVSTPEDPYPVWRGPGGPVTVAPLFVLYDYTFRPAGTTTKEEALAVAHESGVVCTDEMVLHPDPYQSREAWSAERVRITEKRLEDRPPGLPTILVNHWPLTRHPTRVLTYPEFALWCGTEATADWHVRYEAKTVVYGHLHIPRTTYEDGVRFEEVSVGYPREWQRQRHPDPALRQILPVPGAAS
ncbi:metallophosphoesterase family protein [Streptomyces sp. NBC_00370]|uniref:metallophosphoesterase family protein n=1 Tax=Streptomyces sp. NBC_00370 TaxID=2975728 RepID=UPI003FA7B995